MPFINPKGSVRVVEFKSIVDERVRSATLVVGVVINFIIVSDGIDDGNEVAIQTPEESERIVYKRSRFFHEIDHPPTTNLTDWVRRVSRGCRHSENLPLKTGSAVRTGRGSLDSPYGDTIARLKSGASDKWRMVAGKSVCASLWGRGDVLATGSLQRTKR